MQRLALLLAIPTLAYAADGTDLLTHQGRLFDDTGVPLEGSEPAVFSIYDNEGDVTAAWFEPDTLVLSQGYYSAQLGDQTAFPSSLFDDPTLWLGVAVNGEELLPRQQLTAVVYGGGSQISNGYPSQPQLAMDFHPGNYNNHEFIPFPFTFDVLPVVIATIDESLNNSGPSWLRQIDKRRDRSGFLNNDSLDGAHWLAIAPGVHTIGGKTVMAGNQSPATNGGFVTFPQAFSNPPIVLLNTVTLDNSGAVTARVVNTVTTTQFQYYTDANGDAIDWIAFDPGEYNHGRYHFYAGTFPNPATGTTYSWPTAFTDDMVNSPNAVLTIHDTNNNGGVYTRFHAIDDAGMTVYMNSASEVLNYVVFEDRSR